jgi:hypothetical protein
VRIQSPSRRSLIPFALVFLVVPSLSISAAEIRSLGEFEASAFAKQHRPTEKSSWPLKAGGTVTNYSYADPESDSSCSVEIVLVGDRIQRFSPYWYGESTLQPARFTARRERFLRDLFKSMSSQVDVDKIIVYVKANQAVRYPQGVASAPEQLVGGLHLKVGVTGSSLHVVARF